MVSRTKSLLYYCFIKNVSTVWRSTAKGIYDVSIKSNIEQQNGGGKSKDWNLCESIICSSARKLIQSVNKTMHFYMHTFYIKTSFFSF